MADCCDVDIKIEVCSEDKAKALYGYMNNLISRDRTTYFPLKDDSVGVIDASLSILNNEVNLTGYVKWGLHKDAVVALLTNIMNVVDIGDVKLIINYEITSEEDPVIGQYRFIGGDLFVVELSPEEVKEIRADIEKSTDDEDLRLDMYTQLTCERLDVKPSPDKHIWTSRKHNYYQGDCNYTLESRIPEGTGGDMGLWAEVLRLDELNRKKDKLMDRIMAVLGDDTKSPNSRLTRINSYVNKYQAIRNSAKCSLSYDVRTIESNGILE